MIRLMKYLAVVAVCCVCMFLGGAELFTVNFGVLLFLSNVAAFVVTSDEKSRSVDDITECFR